VSEEQKVRKARFSEPRRFVPVGNRVQRCAAGRANAGRCGLKESRMDTFADVGRALDAWLRENDAPRWAETPEERRVG